MKIDYEVNLEDNMNFLAYQVKKQTNPSTNDSIKQWNILCLLMLTILLPALGYVVIQERWAVFVFMMIGLAIFGLLNYKSNLRNTWWRLYKRKARKDLQKMFFPHDNTTRAGSFSVDGSSIVIENEDRKRIYKEKDLQLINADEFYYYIFFKNYEGTLIPKKFVHPKDSEWFEKYL